MKHYLFAFSMLLLCMIGCSKEEDHSGDTAPEETFSSEQLDNLADYSKENGGSAVLIMENGTIIYEDYHNGADIHKSDASTLLFLLIEPNSNRSGIEYENLRQYIDHGVSQTSENNINIAPLSEVCDFVAYCVSDMGEIAQRKVMVRSCKPSTTLVMTQSCKLLSASLS